MARTDPTIGNQYYDQYSGQGMAYAAQYGIPWPIFKGLIAQESGWNPNPPGYNDGGSAFGFGQLHLGAATDAGVADSYKTSPAANLKGAAAYLKQQYDKTGNWSDALARYNDGDNYQSSKGQTYATSIMAWARRWGLNSEGDVSETPKNPVGTGGMTGGDYLTSGGINGTAPSAGPSTAAPGLTLGDFANPFAKLFGIVNPLGLGGQPTVSTSEPNKVLPSVSIVPESIANFFTQLSQIFTLEFWQRISSSMLMGAVIFGLIGVGLYALVAPHTTNVINSAPVKVAKIAGAFL